MRIQGLKMELHSQATIPPTVTVWHIELAQPEELVTQVARLLAVDEQARAARFHFARDRDRFVVARAALRQILGRCLSLAPAAVRFAYSAAGKPSLAPDHAVNIHFNLSHSGAVALVAVTHAAEIGVDVEHQRDLPELVAIARRFFSPREAASLLALPPGQQPAAFYRCWTRKEAYLKARGDGIVGGLDRFDVAFEPGVPAALLRTLDDPAEAARWSLVHLEPAPGYVGALALHGPPPRVELEAWTFTTQRQV